ncbi:hypothetical protein E2C01_091085 [Portunus trituberculatus]|uniref:Uncharacterized protein n=1 Tax=Portunus trituberculatus TaxID=210409 RepID=A0A5B7JNG1_PORTR|nr:hypothetical protein [Portunus trituberculatus]
MIILTLCSLHQRHRTERQEKDEKDERRKIKRQTLQEGGKEQSRDQSNKTRPAQTRKDVTAETMWRRERGKEIKAQGGRCGINQSSPSVSDGHGQRGEARQGGKTQLTIYVTAGH